MPTNPTLAAKDPQILLERIKQVFPEVAWNDFQFIDVGWDHEVIQLDNKYIFRFPNSPEYRALLKDEVALLAYLGAKTKACIPHYTFIADDFSFGGYPMLPGEGLNAERFKGLSGTQQTKVMQSIADFLSDLHALSLSELSQFHVGSEPDFAGYGNVATEAKTYLQPNMPAEDYQLIETMLKDMATVQSCPQPARLTHGDIAPKHLIWDTKTEALGFIDFSDRVISDPAYDFAELYTYGEAFVNNVYAHYRSPDKDDLFLVRAKAYMKAIGVHSLANCYRTEKMQKDEALRLLAIGAGLPV